MKAIVFGIITSIVTFNSFAQSNIEASIDFRVDSIETVNKIIITDNSGGEFELHKKNQDWTDKYGDCVSKGNVKHVLDAFEKIEFKGYLPRNRVRHYQNKDSIAKYKVEIFQNDVKTKTWYIGPPAQDHNGQIIYLESIAVKGKAIPVYTKMKGMVGIIEPRFYTDPNKWKCKTIFSIALNDLSKISVKNNENPESSVEIDLFQNEILIYHGDKQLLEFDTTAVYRYLSNFKEKYYDRANYSLNSAEVDSVKNTTPFAEITVTLKSGFSKTIKCYHLVSQRNVGTENNYDVDRFWCELPPQGELVQCQYFVFNTILHPEYYIQF